MSDPIHVLRDGQQFGPYSIEQISAMLADGSLLPTDLAWSPTANQWVSIMEVVPAQAAPITATVPSQAGKGKMMMAVGGGVLAVAAAVIFVFFNPFSDGEEKSDPPEKEAKKADENVGGNDETPAEPVVPGREPNEKIPVPPIKPGPAKTTMAEVAKHLDFGGSHFTYTSHEGGLDAANLLAELIDGFSSGPNGLGRGEKEVINALQVAYAESGIPEISGTGSSSFTLPSGIVRNVFMVHHRPGKANGLLWKLLGGKTHELGGLKLMPSSVALVMHGDLDVAAVLAWLKDFVPRNFSPDVAREFQNFLDEGNEEIGFERLVNSLDGEMGMSLTLNPAKPIVIPVDGVKLQFPEPGLILACKVKDAQLMNQIKLGMQNGGGPPIQEEQVGGVGLSTIQLPSEDMPWALSPTLFQSGGYVVFTSTKELAREVLAVQQGQTPGLADTDHFKNITNGLEVTGNHLMYISPQIRVLLMQLASRALGQDSGLEPKMREAILKLANYATTLLAHQVVVGKIIPEGLLIDNRTKGLDIPAMSMATGNVATVGVLASMLLPALAKAKQRANTIKSVHNVKQLLGGMLSYAADNGGRLPPANQWCDAIFRDVGSIRVFASPLDPRAVAMANANQRISSYAFNRALIGANLDRLNPQTVVLFECPLGWNGVGTPQQLIEYMQQNPGQRIAIGMADGSAKQATEAMLRQFRWVP